MPGTDKIDSMISLLLLSPPEKKLMENKFLQKFYRERKTTKVLKVLSRRPKIYQITGSFSHYTLSAIFMD